MTAASTVQTSVSAGFAPPPLAGRQTLGPWTTPGAFFRLRLPAEFGCQKITQWFEKIKDHF